MKLTRKQAFDLSIRKWEGIVENGQIPRDILDMNLNYHCGLCEKYMDSNFESFERCKKCPICPKEKTCDSFGCKQNEHPFLLWALDKNPENAQKVLDLIKSKM